MLRIVIAEDEAVIRMDLGEMLTEAGYEVLGSAGDGDAAVEMILALRPDVALVDIAMPGMDGIEVTRQVADTAAVVVLTAFGQRELVDRAAQAGAMGYLVKPVGRDNIVPAIEVAAARWAGADELRAEAEGLARRLADRQDLDRAKGVLMERGMSEATAFAALRQRAMDGRCTLGEAARAVLAEAGIVS